MVVVEVMVVVETVQVEKDEGEVVETGWLGGLGVWLRGA